MQQAEATESPVRVGFYSFEHGFPEGFGPGAWGRLAYAVGVLFAVFQLYVAAFNMNINLFTRGLRNIPYKSRDFLKKNIHALKSCF